MGRHAQLGRDLRDILELSLVRFQDMVGGNNRLTLDHRAAEEVDRRTHYEAHILGSTGERYREGKVAIDTETHSRRSFDSEDTKASQARSPHLARPCCSDSASTADATATRLNSRLRNTLDFDTPADRVAALLH